MKEQIEELVAAAAGLRARMVDGASADGLRDGAERVRLALHGCGGAGEHLGLLNHPDWPMTGTDPSEREWDLARRLLALEEGVDSLAEDVRDKALELLKASSDRKARVGVLPMRIGVDPASPGGDRQAMTVAFEVHGEDLEFQTIEVLLAALQNPSLEEEAIGRILKYVGERVLP